ncbi:unnamed protein product [Colias eurytheme]|nr:unnamed protein product [Colias eurytheme]
MRRQGWLGWLGVLLTRQRYVIYGATWAINSDVAEPRQGAGRRAPLRAHYPPTYLRLRFDVSRSFYVMQSKCYPRGLGTLERTHAPFDRLPDDILQRVLYVISIHCTTLHNFCYCDM